MQLSGIKQFLDVYRKRLDTEDAKKELLQKIINEEIGIFFETKIFFVKKGVLEIKTNTIIKNELFLRKGKILSRLREEFEKGNLPNIHTIQ